MIEHFSWSSMNSFDKDIHQFYTRYVLWEEPVFPPVVKQAMEFGKEYEVWLSKWEYGLYDTQKECSMIIWWYKMYGLFDFYNEWAKEVIEVKTKSGWWSDKDIHESWQFRFYNNYCNKEWLTFKIHQYNKKEERTAVKEINWEDKTFESDFITKAQQIERFLNQFNIQVKHYDI